VILGWVDMLNMMKDHGISGFLTKISSRGS